MNNEDVRLPTETNKKTATEEKVIETKDLPDGPKARLFPNSIDNLPHEQLQPLPTIWKSKSKKTNRRNLTKAQIDEKKAKKATRPPLSEMNLECACNHEEEHHDHE